MLNFYNCCPLHFQLAKAHFQVKQDPLDCAIFYLAMKKKTLLCALFRFVMDFLLGIITGTDLEVDSNLMTDNLTN